MGNFINSITHNFQIVNIDTDSLSICNHMQTPFSKEEQKALLVEINSILPPKIKMDNDGNYDCVIVLKAKNYIMHKKNEDDTFETIYKGSSLKSSTLEPAFKDLLHEMIAALIDDKEYLLQDIYYKYVKLASNITDKETMKRFSTKKTLSTRTFESERTNETKLKAAVPPGSKPGDRFYVFFRNDDSLDLVDNFTGDYQVDRLFEKLFKVMSRFETILPIDEMFPNYSLKKNKKKLQEVLDASN